MTRINPDQTIGAEVVSQDGQSLGKVETLYMDNQTGQPSWVAVKSGLFGTHVSLLPIAATKFDGQTMTVPFSKEQVKSAPHHDPDSEISQQDEQELYQHYQLDYNQPPAPQAGQRPDQAGDPGVQGQDTSGPTTDDAMTRSEEQLRVGTQSVETGKARLRKYVVTENVTQTVPVSHEEVRLEREPITEANRDQAMAGGDITEEEHEVTLHAEQPVVAKETVPVERVRLGTEQVAGKQTVTEEVRKEQIDEPETDQQP
ncbi:MAG: PRC and DUF2382 domain-containing protein [Actinomycetota bacterium]|nr:PRC and DUF2382 domain-containing protein [Actinomycetota bacterium]